jgi:hypothetical protein
MPLRSVRLTTGIVDAGTAIDWLVDRITKRPSPPLL